MQYHYCFIFNKLYEKKKNTIKKQTYKSVIVNQKSINILERLD